MGIPGEGRPAAAGDGAAPASSRPQCGGGARALAEAVQGPRVQRDRIAGPRREDLHPDPARLRADDCLYAGIATAIIDSEQIPDMRKELVGTEHLTHNVVGKIIKNHCKMEYDSPLAKLRPQIDAAFSADSIEGICRISAYQGIVEAIINRVFFLEPNLLRFYFLLCIAV